MFDGTTDISRKEACSVVLRFVELSDAYTPTPKERFIESVFTEADICMHAKTVVKLCCFCSISGACDNRCDKRISRKDHE